MATITGFARITLATGDKRRVFVHLDPNQTPCIGVQSLAELIWTAKCHIEAIKDSSWQYNVHTDKAFVFVKSDDSFFNDTKVACLPIDKCAEWLLKNCNKSALAQKRLKKFLADEWARILAMPARIRANSVDRAMISVCDTLRQSLEHAPDDWKVVHDEFVSNAARLLDSAEKLQQDPIAKK